MQQELMQLMKASFQPRLYQETILGTAVEKNSLVVLPTGMGKTAIAAMLAAHRLAVYPHGKVLFLAPTKPLAEQHRTTFSEMLKIPKERMAVFTGSVAPAERARQWSEMRIIFSTPQGLENDIISKKISLDDVVLLVFDEAHRAIGDYSYVFLATQYIRKALHSRVLALTASPGTELAKIEEVCKNLSIEAVEIRTDQDPDVKPYIQDVQLRQVRVSLPPELKTVQESLNKCINRKLAQLKENGLRVQNANKGELLRVQRSLHTRIAQENDFTAMRLLSLIAEAIKAQHALDLLETQGISPLTAYMEKLARESHIGKSKAAKNIVQDLHFKSALIKTRSLMQAGMEHPKIPALKSLIAAEMRKDPKQKIIIFTQFRDTGKKIREELAALPNVLPELFVGQAKKSGTGLSQKRQIEMLDHFRDGLFNVLVATSVAEEGLDIPCVDMVVFYEPIPSAIRTIQRRGRTGRQDKGRVVVFIAKGTRDEGYHWGAKHKERRMHQFLSDMRKSLSLKILSKPQTDLRHYDTPPTLCIFADYREKGRGVLKLLSEQDINLKLEMLKTADYLCSQRVGVEIKEAGDFVDSIVDGRLLAQLKELKRSFERPLVIVQGKQDIYSVRNVHPNAIRGMLATIAVSYGIPIIYTKNDEETAALLITVAKREQGTRSNGFSPHANRKPMSVREAQEYLISAIPLVGPSAAKELLAHFSSVKAIFNASQEELKRVPGIGEKIATSIMELAQAGYEKDAL